MKSNHLSKISVLTFVLLMTNCSWFTGSGDSVPIDIYLKPSAGATNKAGKKSLIGSTGSMKGFDLGMKIPGISQVAGIIKGGVELVKGVGGIVDNIFGNSKRINNGFNDVRAGLHHINSKIAKIRSEHELIYQKLITMENNIITAINDAAYLDASHLKIIEAINAASLPDKAQLSGAIFNLAKNEYRPSKIDNVIVGFETYLGYYAPNTGSKSDKRRRIDELTLVIVEAENLKNNLYKFNNLHEAEIDILVGQLVSYYSIVRKVKPVAVERQFDLDDLNYYNRVESINDFDLIPGNDNWVKSINTEHTKTKVRIEELLKVSSLYLAFGQMVDNYIEELKDERETLKNAL